VAYANPAAGGARADPLIDARVVADQGMSVYEASAENERVLDAEVPTDRICRPGLSGRLSRHRHSGGPPGPPDCNGCGHDQRQTARPGSSAYTPRLATWRSVRRRPATGPCQRWLVVREVTGGSRPARIWGSYTAEARKRYPAMAFSRPARRLQSATVALHLRRKPNPTGREPRHRRVTTWKQTRDNLQTRSYRERPAALLVQARRGSSGCTATYDAREFLRRRPCAGTPALIETIGVRSF
jgi:hypothetical protein